MMNPPDPSPQLTSIDQHGQQVGTQHNAGRDIHIHAARPWQPWPEPTAEQARMVLELLPRDQLPEMSPFPSCSRMPFPPNPHFVGRDAILRSLAAVLHGGERVTISPKAAVTGLGGIGKTSVAAEFVHRYGSYFAGGVFWLSFADPVAIPSEIAACGGPGLLDLHPAYGELRQDEQVALVRQAWQRPTPRLLIFDNCEDFELMRAWAPSSGGCRVLLTSRRQSWPGSLRVSAFALDVLARPASVELVRNVASHLAAEAADSLAEELGDFPLALQLASSYLAQYRRIRAATYLAELQSEVILNHPSLRGLHDDVLTTAHDRHVGRTFLLSYQRLDPVRDALALALLTRAACLAPGAPIPAELLLASAGVQPGETTGEMALGRLIDLGFVTLGDETVFLHRLVHAFVGAEALDGAALAAVEEALSDQSLLINTAGYPPAMAPLLPHLAWAIRGTVRADAPMARLCTSLGSHWQATGAYASAQLLYERALAICEAVLGPDHPDTAASLNHLASLYDDLGIYTAAQPLYERALAIREQVLGPDHPDTAASLNNLAALYDTTGAIAAAQPLYERALAIRERVLGPDHPDTAMSLTNLAVLHHGTEAYAVARPLYEQALDIRERVLRADHPHIAFSLNNLAELHMAMEDYETARPLYQRALAIRERVLGSDHPHTAISLTNLAGLYAATAAYAAARPLYERALAIFKRSYGIDHDHTKMVRASIEELHATLEGAQC